MTYTHNNNSEKNSQNTVFLGIVSGFKLSNFLHKLIGIADGKDKEWLLSQSLKLNQFIRQLLSILDAILDKPAQLNFAPLVKETF